ncbi:hypothetical protein PVAP13_1KG524808 [Panicum virgatum]|uniref:Uncharacterized protein n=1 Tax=Panicum virgatum TaxID=38727 RepID=A0A8T0XZ07_PANVG|nr:hypothetical protein PVAP13_1KG524808 [Panicum virgatum]
MAAVALLRSVASKMARAPPMHRRPLLARGLHAGARSEAAASGYALPPASNEQARLRSVLTKLARAPPPRHRLLPRRAAYLELEG